MLLPALFSRREPAANRSSATWRSSDHERLSGDAGVVLDVPFTSTACAAEINRP